METQLIVAVDFLGIALATVFTETMAIRHIPLAIQLTEMMVIHLTLRVTQLMEMMGTLHILQGIRSTAATVHPPTVLAIACT